MILAVWGKFDRGGPQPPPGKAPPNCDRGALLAGKDVSRCVLVIPTRDDRSGRQGVFRYNYLLLTLKTNRRWEMPVESNVSGQGAAIVEQTRREGLRRTETASNRIVRIQGGLGHLRNAAASDEDLDEFPQDIAASGRNDIASIRPVAPAVVAANRSSA